MAGFDRVARIYRALEYAAFGATLQRARTAHVDRLRGCRDVLFLGDGDGRFLAALLAAAPHARVTSVDASAAMLTMAAARVHDDDSARVTFTRADMRTITPPPQSLDAIVTLFSLDCVSDDDVRAVVRRLAPALRAQGQWLFADFALPPRGLARLHARVVVAALYLFFRWQTHIPARALPQSERWLSEAGLVLLAETSFRAGLIRSAVYARAAGGQ